MRDKDNLLSIFRIPIEEKLYIGNRLFHGMLRLFLNNPVWIFQS